MRKLLLAAVAALLLTSFTQAQNPTAQNTSSTEKPLQALPYTPSLLRQFDG